MDKFDCKHFHPGRYQSGNVSEKMEIRMLRKSDFEVFTVSDGKNIPVKTLDVTPNIVKKHLIDQRCVIIPSTSNHSCAYRYIPSDDIPTLVPSNLSYIRCQTEEVAITLAIWLSSKNVSDAILTESRRGGTTFKRLFRKIPIPEIVLRGTVLENVKCADRKLIELNNLASRISTTDGKLSFSCSG